MREATAGVPAGIVAEIEERRAGGGGGRRRRKNVFLRTGVVEVAAEAVAVATVGAAEAIIARVIEMMRVGEIGREWYVSLGRNLYVGCSQFAKNDIRTLSYSLLFTYRKVQHPCLPRGPHNQC